MKAFHTENDEIMRLIAMEAKSINGYRDGWRLAFKPDEMEAVLEYSIFKSIFMFVEGTVEQIGNESF